MRGVCEVVVAEAQSVGGVNQHRVLGMNVPRIFQTGSCLKMEQSKNRSFCFAGRKIAVGNFSKCLFVTQDKRRMA